MNYIDLIILLILVGSIVGGIKNGFIAELASLIALIIGVWGAIKFAGSVQSLLVYKWNWNIPYIGVVSFVVTLLIIAVSIHLLAHLIQKMADMANLKIANRVLGAFLSFFKTAFFLGVVIILADKLAEKATFIPTQKIKESKFSKPLHTFSLSAFPFLQGIYSDLKSDKKEEQD
jgi:membrane protein required for colicin V production